MFFRGDLLNPMGVCVFFSFGGVLELTWLFSKLTDRSRSRAFKFTCIWGAWRTSYQLGWVIFFHSRWFSFQDFSSSPVKIGGNNYFDMFFKWLAQIPASFNMLTKLVFSQNSSGHYWPGSIVFYHELLAGQPNPPQRTPSEIGGR